MWNGTGDVNVSYKVNNVWIELMSTFRMKSNLFWSKIKTFGKKDVDWFLYITLEKLGIQSTLPKKTHVIPNI